MIRCGTVTPKIREDVIAATKEMLASRFRIQFELVKNPHVVLHRRLSRWLEYRTLAAVAPLVDHDGAAELFSMVAGG